MENFMKEFQHLEIQLKEIKLSTENFAESRIIGRGGFGNVYRGDISHYKGRTAVAIKRLDSIHGQGNTEFWKEIMTLSRYTHKNLVSLVGYCSAGNEKILVYELVSRGSLDRFLSSTALTWMQRLKICVDAARGLSYLHDPRGSQQRVLHRDIKSSNILLDEKWNAKISDMGLSKFGPANQQHTVMISNAVGTLGYVDPLYIHTGMLTKESDVYSFGVVLFEVMCGRLCFQGQPEILVRRWKQSYEMKKLGDIIFRDLIQHMDSTSLEKFSSIAFQCLHESREQRPTMANVLKHLEVALQYQEIHERMKLPKDYKEILETAVLPLKYRSKSELKKHLLKGILVNHGKTWFSVNMKGEHCEIISIAECLTSTASESQRYISSSELGSRFAVGCYEPLRPKFKTHVRTQFLSPLVTYTVNLVFKYKEPDEPYIGLECTLEGKTTYSFLSDERDDGWLMAELYHFTCNESIVDLEIELNTEHCPSLLIEGIEFQPLDKVEDEVLTDVVETQPISDTEAYWEQKLPNDYEDIIKWSKYGVRWNTKKELYDVLCHGFLVNDGQEWFSLAKNGKKCLMLPARAALMEEGKWGWKSVPNTRFKEVADCISKKFQIICKFRSKMLSSQTTYATYLVYKLQKGYKSFEAFPVQVKDMSVSGAEPCHMYLRTPQTPVIRWNRNVIIDQKTHNPTNRPRIKCLPQQRTDGWMELQVSKFQTRDDSEMILTRLKFSSYDMFLEGITVLGVECRPI